MSEVSEDQRPYFTLAEIEASPMVFTSRRNLTQKPHSCCHELVVFWKYQLGLFYSKSKQHMLHACTAFPCVNICFRFDDLFGNFFFYTDGYFYVNLFVNPSPSGETGSGSASRINCLIILRCLSFEGYI